jgi:ABC-type transporter Mla MlaB component
MGTSAPQTITLAIDGPITRADLPSLSERFRAVLRASGAGAVVCDVQSCRADCVTVEALCRLQLVARRRGCTVGLRHASSELLELVAFMGLAEVLPAQASSRAGRPKSGKSVSVSRKNVSSPIRPPEISST